MAKLKPNKAAKIRTLMKAWDDDFEQNNKHFFEMQDFIVGKQWDDREKTNMSRKGKLPLIFNVVNPLSNNIIGEVRMNTPNIVIEPSDDIPEQVAMIRSALIKDITFESKATVAYQNSFEHSLNCGYGAWLVGRKYKDNKSFIQEITVEHMEEPTKCYWDIGAKLSDKTDGMHCGYRVLMTRRKFISIFGSAVANKIGYTDYATNNKRVKNPDQSENTSQAKSIKEAEGGDVLTNEKFITVIYHSEKKSGLSTLYEMSDDSCLTADELKALTEYNYSNNAEYNEFGEEIFNDNPDVESDADEGGEKTYLLNGQPVTIVREREIEDDEKIVDSVWAGDYELEKSEIAIKRLPLIFLDQKSYIDKEGKQITSSFFKNSKDPQRLLNYCKSQQAYIMMTARYDQFMGTADMIASPESQEIWSDPSNKQGMLTFDKVKGSEGMQMPTQLQAPQIPRELMTIDESAMVYIQHTTGIYDTQLGNQGDVVSGIASNHQSRKGSKNTFIARDNLNRAIAVTAEIIDEMIPILYDTQRSVRLNLPDRGMKNVMLNQPSDQYGNQMNNDMTQGNYKIRLVVGPSTEDEKSDQIQSWEMLLQASPGTAANMMDLVAKSLPLKDVIEVANRYRAMVDPKILEAGKTGEPIQQNQQPDPQMLMVQIEMQKLQQQQQKNQADYQIKLQQLELDKANLQLKAMETHQDMTTEIAKISAMQEEAKQRMIEENNRTQAEYDRMLTDEHIAHHNNIKDIVNAGYARSHEARENQLNRDNDKSNRTNKLNKDSNQKRDNE